MLVIRDCDGNIIHRSANLLGVRRYLGRTKSPIKVLSISKVGEWEGNLSILWEDGCSYKTLFASYVCLKDFIKRWRNTYWKCREYIMAYASVRGWDLPDYEIVNDLFVWADESHK